MMTMTCLIGVVVAESRDGEVSVWPTANVLPMASWKIMVDISPVCAAFTAADAICFAVILPPEAERLSSSQLLWTHEDCEMWFLFLKRDRVLFLLRCKATVK